MDDKFILEFTDIVEGELIQDLRHTLFVLGPTALVTVTFTSYAPITQFLPEPGDLPAQPAEVLKLLLSSSVLWCMRSLHLAGHNLDALSDRVFSLLSGSMQEDILRAVGNNGEIISRIQEDLVKNRIACASRTGVGSKQDINSIWAPLEGMRLARKEIDDALDLAALLASRVSLLLDANIGAIGIRDNKIASVYMIVSTVFLPPMMIASVYGMNFREMPELHWDYSYPVCVVVMIATAILPWYLINRWYLKYF